MHLQVNSSRGREVGAGCCVGDATVADGGAEGWVDGASEYDGVMAITRIHHLNCGTMCPAGAPLVGSDGGWLTRGKMVCHCLLVETSGDGLVLVDTGIGAADARNPERFPAPFRAIAAPRFDINETAVAQVVALGYEPSDVRHIIVTHLDLDHAGGLGDFPAARVHIHAAEHRAAMSKPTFAERQRYVSAQWAHGPEWRTYDESGEDWFGLRAIKTLEGINEDIALVPLFGHSRGHSGIAVRDGDGWLLHAGDAYFNHAELSAADRCPPGLRLFQRLAQIDGRARIANADRLRALHRDHRDQVRIFSAHDPKELERFAS